MISVRVNEILKYLSSDKKERLKRCVQMENSQKLDSSRTHRNNVANALSSSASSSSSSSSVSVAVEAESQEESLGSTGSFYQMPPTSSGLTVKGDDEELREAKEKFLNNSGDNELHKDYKKRRPLTVLKSHNVQCLPSSYSSSPTSETSLSLAPNSPLIPSDRLSRDVKQLNGYNYTVSTKSDPTKKSPSSPADSRGGQLQLGSESVRQETKSHRETSDAGTATKGKSKQIENRKHSKRKTGSSSAIATEAEEEEEAAVTVTNTKEEPAMGNKSKRFSEAGGGTAAAIDHLQPLTNASSPPSLSMSSRRSKKQNKQKDTAHNKIPVHVVIGTPCHEFNELSDNASSYLLNVKMSPKLRHSVEEHSKERTSTKEKDKKLDPVKGKVCVWPGGYTSTSGVAELDTFEITSIRNQKLATKRISTDKCIADRIHVSSSNEVNALDTFDDPVVRPVARRFVDSSSSSSVQQKQRDPVAGKWIQVNRKVKRLVVPSAVVSHILGSNGSKLDAICQVTRAHIELEKTTNAREMIFVLRGTLEQMQAASNMISALMKDSKSSLDSCAKSANIQQIVKNGSPLHFPPQPPVLASKDFKSSLKFGQSPPPPPPQSPSPPPPPPPPVPVSSVTTNASIIPEKSSTPQVPQANGFGENNDEDYAESIPSSASERSDPCSERCSPAQDLLVGEYSLFEHGLGQPLEKLLARNDSSKQTFAARAAAANVRMPNRTLTPIIPNRSAIDQLLLAKAPGYRNAKAMYGGGRDPGGCFGKVADLGCHMSSGRFGWPLVNSGRGLERTKENDSSSSRCCTASQFLSSVVGSSNAHIPPLERRPLSAPGFPSAHSSSSSSALATAHDRSVAPPSDHLLTVQTFSNLNPNAPDFVFTLPLEDASGSRIVSMLSLEPCGSHLLHSPVDPSADGSGCSSSDGSAGEFSYSMSRLVGTFESVSVDVPDLSPGGSVGRDGGGFGLPGSAVDDGMYVPPPPPLGGDNLNAPWLCTPESWHPSKVSYGGMGRGGEQVLPGTTAISSYPSRGELYRSYFAHPPFSPITSSPYNCAFYQQQQQQSVMLAPVQSWSHTTQTVAQAGP